MNFLVARPEQIIESVSQKIIREIERARYAIWIANVWFTDNDIYDTLIEKVKEGLNVEIILDKTKFLDCRELAKIQDFIDAGGEFYMSSENRQKHSSDKGFCMVDYTVVIDDIYQEKPYKTPGFSTYFLREYPETIIEHYVNQYFTMKHRYCVNRYS